MSFCMSLMLCKQWVHCVWTIDSIFHLATKLEPVPAITMSWMKTVTKDNQEGKPECECKHLMYKGSSCVDKPGCSKALLLASWFYFNWCASWVTVFSTHSDYHCFLQVRTVHDRPGCVLTDSRGHRRLDFACLCRTFSVIPDDGYTSGCCRISYLCVYDNFLS